MLGSGTTYYTSYLNSLADYKVAWHEQVYTIRGPEPPAPNQQIEVSGWSFPWHTDILLVRDPRRVLRGLKFHSPGYQNHTEEWLGYRANTLTLLVRSYIEFTEMALARYPEVVRIEDVPRVPGLKDNATGRGYRKPHEWHELGQDVIDLAKEFGYDVDL